MKVLWTQTPGSDEIQFFEKLKSIHPDVQFELAETIKQELSSVIDADVYYGWPSNEVFNKANNLKWIHCPGTGVDRITEAIPDLADSEVILTNCRGPHANPMADHVLGMMLTITHRLNEQWDDQKARRWETYKYADTFLELTGKSMGILALGDIGKAVARRAYGFGMSVYAVDIQKVEKIPEVVEVWGMDKLDDLISKVDWFVVTAPITKDTSNLIDARRIGLLKEDAYIVIISRGGIVDEEALANALSTKSIAGAAIDAFAIEPLADESPFWDMGNCIISAHASAYSKEMAQGRKDIFQENLRRYMNKESFLYVCDKKAGF